MKRETTQVRAATRTNQSPGTTLLVGTLYGFMAGMALALAIAGGLLPVNWAADYSAGPLAFQGLLSAAGALAGAVVARIRNARR